MPCNFFSLFFSSVIRSQFIAAAPVGATIIESLKTCLISFNKVVFPVPAEVLASLVEAVQSGAIPAGMAGKVMDRMAETGSGVAAILAEEDLQQISASDELALFVDKVIEAHPNEVEAVRGGREQVFGFLMGEVMRATRGKANPDTARKLLRARIKQ